ncbi:BadF/BadG/BcrA/BcrD ATPase family protein [Chitinasiproducens palmae]|uniref:Glucosamine kinase n=1 Tax=Chitinasiproducens palmae TaxID=1770053 RepID=A0A1H2PQA7_9BURK|nr:BadF/BadG/BcrA/BcrD ATPase family protein [Chitinasiproducens palmae]SDV48566.1 glucosamine kinase [Chitinasiproducens palmae]
MKVVSPRRNTPSFLLGVDGGGTGTRAKLARVESAHLVIGTGAAGPSGLALGVDSAWQAVIAACEAAFAATGHSPVWEQCALVCGLAGVNHPEWRAQFLAAAPVFAQLDVVSDAYSTVVGAHDGAPGIAIALGTGSVGLRLLSDGGMRMVGGWGFPSADEASGAWLGLRAIVHAQQALDGRVPRDDFAQALLRATGTGDRDALQVWLSDADQTRYASLAPLVLTHAQHPVCAGLLAEAARQVERMVDALDGGERPALAFCGSLAEALLPYLPATLRARAVGPRGDSASGALTLAARLIDRHAT